MAEDYRSSPRRTNNSPIARLRMERGMTQGQLAALIGCNAQDVGRWERGERKPGAKSLLSLSRALNCSIDEILAEEKR